MSLLGRSRNNRTREDAGEQHGAATWLRGNEDELNHMEQQMESDAATESDGTTTDGDDRPNTTEKNGNKNSSKKKYVFWVVLVLLLIVVLPIGLVRCIFWLQEEKPNQKKIQNSNNIKKKNTTGSPSKDIPVKDENDDKKNDPTAKRGDPVDPVVPVEPPVVVNPVMSSRERNGNFSKTEIKEGLAVLYRMQRDNIKLTGGRLMGFTNCVEFSTGERACLLCYFNSLMQSFLRTAAMERRIREKGLTLAAKLEELDLPQRHLSTKQEAAKEAVWAFLQFCMQFYNPKQYNEKHTQGAMKAFKRAFLEYAEIANPGEGNSFRKNQQAGVTQLSSALFKMLDLSFGPLTHISQTTERITGLWYFQDATRLSFTDSNPLTFSAVSPGSLGVMHTLGVSSEGNTVPIANSLTGTTPKFQVTKTPLLNCKPCKQAACKNPKDRREEKCNAIQTGFVGGHYSGELLNIRVSRVKKGTGAIADLPLYEKELLQLYSGAKYKLVGISIHRGPNNKSGHYTTYALHNDVWYNFDDRTARKVTNPRTEIFKNETVQTNATLLVFQRIGDEEN